MSRSRLPGFELTRRIEEKVTKSEYIKPESPYFGRHHNALWDVRKRGMSIADSLLEVTKVDRWEVALCYTD